MSIPNFHAIEVKYLGPTNTKGSRVKLTSSRYNQSVTIPYNYEHRDALETAQAWLLDKGYAIAGSCSLSDRDIVFTTTFVQFK